MKVREARLVAEDQAAHVGVQPVRADDEVEAARRPRSNVTSPSVGDRGDRVAEEVLDVVAGGVVEDLAQVVAHDLDVPVGHRAEQRRRSTSDGARAPSR